MGGGRKTIEGYHVPPPDSEREDEEHDTDPDVFRHRAVTKRTCMCGREIPPDETATLRALHLAVNTLHELVREVVDEETAEIVTRRFSRMLGVDLL